MKHIKTFEAYQNINEDKDSAIKEMMYWVKSAEGKKITVTMIGENYKEKNKLIQPNKNGLWQLGDIWIDFNDEFENTEFELVELTPKVLHFKIIGGWELKLEK